MSSNKVAQLVLDGARLKRVHDQLLARFGPLSWWPAESQFEVMVGAILTQNTAWVNVERAIANLRDADCLSPDGILALEQDALAELLRPSGYFNVKAKRLRNLVQWCQDKGGVGQLAQWQDEILRRGLLSVNGVGKETADDIMLYALERPFFVIDAYTRRLFSRLGMIAGDEDYDQLRLAIETALGADTALFNEYHALIVNLAKDFCRVKPLCTDCPLVQDCAFSKD